MIEKKAEILNDNGAIAGGREMGFVVHLFKGQTPFGTIDVRDKSIHYANDVCENWINGILGEDNEFINKFA